MIESAMEISRRTFLSHVSKTEIRRIEQELGYSDHPSRGITMAGDYAVSYYRGKLHGERVYFFVWSAIEHVFIQEETFEELAQIILNEER